VSIYWPLQSWFKMTGKKKDKALNFEGSLDSLEGIVRELESGELDLEKSLEKFEQGVVLFKDCKTLLDKAEKKISVLTESLDEEDLDQ
jgi:exodeoxyribonuclease VII small subunit